MIEVIASLLKGVPTTLGVTSGAFILGIIGGIPLVAMSRSRRVLLRIPARIFIDVMRGIPAIVWLFLIFFGLGSGILVLNSLQAAILGMGLVSVAYLAEIYRGGLIALPIGQREAATALGLSSLDTFRYILSPQVFRVSVPPMATYFVSLLKDTAVASTIGVRDILMFASQQAQSGRGAFLPFILAAILYILLSIPVAIFSREMDHRLRSREAR
jgi:polar amino acid transport system permease protein